MSDFRVGGIGADGCLCTIQASGCPVHHCYGCGEYIQDPDVSKSMPWGRIHPWCQQAYEAKRSAEIDKLRRKVQP